MDTKRIKHLVVDSGGFIRNCPVHEYADQIYTVDGVVKEIKDKATRERLQFLPYKLLMKEPSTESIKYVSEFSKKTGDYSNLSAIDLKIIALTYQLEKEYVGVDHLNKEPTCQVTGKPGHIDSKLCGFYYPKEKSLSESSDSEKTESTRDSMSGVFDSNSESEKITKENPDIDSNSAEDVYENAKSEVSSDTDYESANEADDDYSEGEDEEDSDLDSWITPSNIADVQKKMNSLALDESSSVVACISTDFSVQNVLIQMGLRVISVEGMLIKQAKVFILRCHACFKTTNDNSKKFCPNCGNKTLKRVGVTVNDDGSKKIHINFRRPINIRGKRYSLPTPKGGKHAFNPLTCEDQPTPQNRLPKKWLQKTNALHDDYEAQKSPFATNDVYSRAVHLGVHVRHHFDKRNPNANAKRTGNKKKK
ncbi:RNA-binding protein NOB1 [Parasteatoda tepidariorum]|nr:RNA-binding protein NOB1 [Parasteatoda tepidariorum]